MNHHYQNLLNELMPLSESKNDQCLLEWRPTKNHKDGTMCICGNMLCLKLYEIKNEKTQKYSWVGSECIKKFMGDIAKEMIIEILNKEKRLKNLKDDGCKECAYKICRCETPTTHCKECRYKECKCKSCVRCSELLPISYKYQKCEECHQLEMVNEAEVNYHQWKNQRLTAEERDSINFSNMPGLIRYSNIVDGVILKV